MGKVYRAQSGWMLDEELAIPTDAVELAYLAGLLDGEGCITKRNDRHGYWSVSVGMTDLEIPEYLKSIGGHVSYKPTRGRRKPVADWRLGRQRHVFWFLMAVKPYMRGLTKKSKAEQCMSEIAEKFDV